MNYMNSINENYFNLINCTYKKKKEQALKIEIFTNLECGNKKEYVQPILFTHK